MEEKQESVRQEVIQKLIQYIQQHADSQRAKLLTQLVAHLYRTIPLEDFTTRSIEDLYAIANSYLEFMSNRKPGEAKIRLYNPKKATDQWESTHTIVELSYDDMAFLLDSMRLELDRLGYTIHLIISAGGMKVERDANGQLLEIFPPESEAQNGQILPEAIIHIEIDRENDTEVLEKLHHSLAAIIHDVTAVVQDWHAMSDELQNALHELEQLTQVKQLDQKEVAESILFLKWLADNRFTFLGSRRYEVIGEGDETAFKLVHNSGLGVLRDESTSKEIRYFHELPSKARKLWLSKHLLIIAKTNTKATVHRSAYTDYIGVKRFDAHGKFIGEFRFIGLYTSDAYNNDPLQIPFLRNKVGTVLQKFGLPRQGHGARALRNILSTLPRDDLFQANTDELYELSLGILNLQERRLIRLFVRKDAYNRYFSCLVYVPRDNFNTELLRKMEAILKQAFHGIETSFTTQFRESILAVIHFVIRVNPKVPVKYNLNEIQDQLIAIGRSWYDDLRESLIAHFNEEQGTELFHRYQHTFPAGYRENFPATEAVQDIIHIEKLKSPQDLEMSFFDGKETDVFRLKLFHLDTTIPLSDALPIFEKMGLRVIGEQPYEIKFQDGSSAWINGFNMEYDANLKSQISNNHQLFEESFYKIWLGEVENDQFNRLVLHAQLNWHEITLFRAYAKYLRQVGFTFSQNYIEDAFVANPSIAATLFQLFKLRFDPKLNQTDNTEAIQNLETQLKTAIDQVSNIDHDRILRRYWALIKATLRTNFFQYDEHDQPKKYLSMKFNPKDIPDVPLPLPKYEVFVYSPRFEGVHLRADKVARGGIRWSDRREDFRTEVLGLMKAQQVKNALIVPAGAKGGFIPKILPADGNRDATLQEAIACYQKYIRGLLDITDNLVGSEVVHPKQVVLHDENDPYLVVAADKGTASFSDIANTISKEYQFWLGDAFASGGKTGYDHKKMAITSRGAWESVKHHFQLLQMDITQPFTVVGIGDMSGDVFGNGMLLSDKIKLIAAFNHMHIFIDPNPDPATSYQERQRLFNLPRSTWDDYNRNLLSAGGQIYSRQLKSITLSPEAQAVLKLKSDTLEPNELIRAILKAPVDLIWNGGIGTYVKSSQEQNANVGDRSNDEIRINGSDLNCRIVAEGGNLGWTQLGRIEYELNGGKINTDFVDNSGGVDCSDHEVNIKILLDDIVQKGKMTEAERNQLLADMQEEVAKLVLHDNYRQVRAITRETFQSVSYLKLYMSYLDHQEATGHINRKLEFLPTDMTLLERKTANKSLTRPEIAVIMAYNKIILKKDILKSHLTKDPYLIKFIYTAFPGSLAQRFGEDIQHHKLQHEIIATQLSNAIVNEMGIAFVFQLRNETGVASSAVVQAYVIMRELFNMGWVLQQISQFIQQNPTAANLELEMTLEAMRLTRRGVRWLLRNIRPPYDIAKTIEDYAPHINQIYQELPQLLIGTEKENFETKLKSLTTADVSTEVALKIASARYIYSALNIILISTEQKANLHEVASIYFELAERLDLVWFRESINSYPVNEEWSILARSSFKDELDTKQRALTVSVLNSKEKEADIHVTIENWLTAHHPALQRWQNIITQMRSITVIDAAMLTVAIRALDELAK